MSEEIYLIDTSAWILVLRPNAPEAAKAIVDQLIATNRAATTDVIFLELLAGSRTERECEELQQDLEALIYLPISHELWVKAARFSFTLRRQGLTVPTLDVLIAAVAIENGVGVLHADRHFDLIGQHASLKVRNLLGLTP
jgi:predicted nucleic acid-binding protein